MGSPQMAEDRRTPREKLLARIEGKVQRLFIHLVDRCDKSDSSLAKLQRWEEWFQRKISELRKTEKYRQCRKKGHDWVVTTLDGPGGVSKCCLRCGNTMGIPDGCLYVFDDEVIEHG